MDRKLLMNEQNQHEDFSLIQLGQPVQRGWSVFENDSLASNRVEQIRNETKLASNMNQCIEMRNRERPSAPGSLQSTQPLQNQDQKFALERQHQQDDLSLALLGESVWSGFAEPSSNPQRLNQFPDYGKALQNPVKLSENVANNMFNPFGLAPSSSTLFSNSTEPTLESQVLNQSPEYMQNSSKEAANDMLDLFGLTPAAQPFTDPWEHLTKYNVNPAPNCIEPSHLGTKKTKDLNESSDDELEHLQNMVNDLNLMEKRKKESLSSYSLSASSSSSQSVRTRALNNVMRFQKARKPLPIISVVTSKRLDLSTMKFVSLVDVEETTARKYKSKCKDEPNYFEKNDGEGFERYDVDYEMSRKFAKKQNFEIFGCNFCAGRNKLFHTTDECQVLKKRHKSHQLATGVFCFKCVLPNHRTQDCKQFSEGCNECQSQHHSEWTHDLMSRLKGIWGISCQEDALQKCRTKGSGLRLFN